MDKRPLFPDSLTVLNVFLLQVQVVFGGTLFVSLVMAAYEYDASAGGTGGFNQQCLFVRHYGMLLLLFPALWISGALYYGREAASRDFRRTFLVIGVVALLFGIVYYMACAWSCTLVPNADIRRTPTHNGFFGFPF